MNKISIIMLTVTICSICAEPPNYRQQRLRQFSRQEVTTEQDQTTNDTPHTQSSPSFASGPYSPVGWKPAGKQLVLPSRQQQQYGVPQQYGAPTTEYDTNDEDVSSTSEASDSTDSNETTDDPDSESVDDSPSQVAANINRQPQQEQIGYFVQLADGSIQKVLYVATPNNAVAAKLQLQRVAQAQPFFVQPFYIPQTVSFSSQYQSW